MTSVIDQVADIYLTVRSDGGRFFIDDNWACYKGENAQGGDADSYRGKSQFGVFYVKFLMFAREAQKRGM